MRSIAAQSGFMSLRGKDAAPNSAAQPKQVVEAVEDLQRADMIAIEETLRWNGGRSRFYR